jgi:prevent-host-death family protein
MTMKVSKTVAAGKFKAECLALLDSVAATGQSYIVTKHGRPVAEVVPVRRGKARSLIGSVTVHGDIVGPLLGAWDMDK